MQYFDMHSHILPSFDDGAKTVDDSLELLDCLKKQNVINVCFTPHFYTNEMSVERFIEKRRVAYENFLPYKPENMNIVLGAEVYVTKFLFGSDDLSGLTYGKSRYILTEFSYNSSFLNRTLQQLNMLIDNHRLIPVLPHVERYDILMSDMGALQELRDMGVVIQTNIGHYTKKTSFFKRRKLLKLIGEEMIDILGSDAHSLTHNTPEVYSQAVDMIAEKCGERTVRKMMQNAESIFTAALGEPLNEEE